MADDEQNEAGPQDDDLFAEPIETESGASPYGLKDPPPAWQDPAPATRVTAARPARRKPKTGGFWFLMGCNLIVFVTSVCIMVLELTASRLIAKHVGSSLYTWTSVIGVVLAGITVGNFLGGWLADRFEPKKTLGWLFLTASVLSFSVLWLDQTAMEMDRPFAWSWPAWVLCIVAGIFLLPSVAMGTISPVVASMALSRSTRTGMTVGNVYAWGALGSIVGTFLTGFLLIDLFGSKAIIGMTALTLAAMGVLIASGQRAFRAAVVFGWIQFIGVMGLAASSTADMTARVCRAFGGVLSIRADKNAREAKMTEWANFGNTIGGHFHQLGLTLGLRGDLPGEYHDESNYSYINVADEEEDGEQVKYLKLDKLIHSYYNPDQPTELYYEYELIYAAITERAAAEWDRKTSVSVGDDAGVAAILQNLPDWAHYDPQEKTLSIDGALNATRLDKLLEMSPSIDYWDALQTLYENSNELYWGGFESQRLEALPAGVGIPESLSQTLQYDPTLQMLNAYAVITDEDLEQLIEAAPHADYYRMVQQLHAKSRQTSTMFIGGGGFIFPRWIEAKFPESPTIHVAELDPAVHLAVREELGLPPADKTAVKTFIADARNFVDDRLQHNAKRRQAGKKPVLYDFIYGDAFNDFSVPWHLTTVEFTEKVKLLLGSEGVYLVNIIDIYPRTGSRDDEDRITTVEMRGDLPEGLVNESLAGKHWVPAAAPFAELQVQRTAKHRFKLRFEGEMSDSFYESIYVIADTNAGFTAALDDLHEQSSMPLPVKGPLPQQLLTGDETVGYWQTLPAPFEAVEIQPVGDGKYALAYRGVMSGKTRDKLIALDSGKRAFIEAVNGLHRLTRQQKAGRFLGRYVNTVAQVFPNVYVFSSETGQPGDDRDTFVIACSMNRLDLSQLPQESDYWNDVPFGSLETNADSGERRASGQINAVLGLAEGKVLTDDFAPVDNLLSPVFVRQD